MNQKLLTHGCIGREYVGRMMKFLFLSNQKSQHYKKKRPYSLYCLLQFGCLAVVFVVVSLHTVKVWLPENCHDSKTMPPNQPNSQLYSFSRFECSRIWEFLEICYIDNLCVALTLAIVSYTCTVHWYLIILSHFQVTIPWLLYGFYLVKYRNKRMLTKYCIF